MIDELHEPVLASALLSSGVHEDQEVGHGRGHAGVGEIDELHVIPWQRVRPSVEITLASRGTLSSL